MPFVNIAVTREGEITKDQKRQLIQGVSQLLKDVLHKDPSLTMVVIEEVDTDNWGFKGEQVTELRKQEKSQIS